MQAFLLDCFTSTKEVMFSLMLVCYLALTLCLCLCLYLYLCLSLSILMVIFQVNPG